MTAGADTLAISPAARAALAEWLDQRRALDGAAENTIRAYGRDVAGWLGFLALHRGGTEGLAALADVSQGDLRAWMAQARGDGRGARSLSRALSALKSFARWLAERTKDRGAEFLAMTGEHAERAGETALAIDCFEQAGKEALRRFANTAAVAVEAPDTAPP